MLCQGWTGPIYICQHRHWRVSGSLVWGLLAGLRLSSGLDLFDGHFFGAMEWLMFFSRAPSALMVFQWFCQRWTITIKCFLTSRPSTSMVFRWFSDFLGRWLTMVLKFQGYKKCVNSTRDKMCFRNAGERITALNSFRRAESYERGTDRDLIFLEIGTKSNRNPGRPKQGPNRFLLQRKLFVKGIIINWDG